MKLRAKLGERVRGAAVILLLFACALAVPAMAQEQGRSILHLLDYIGVDYAGAVDNGKVVNADEFKEMQQFAAEVGTLMKALPDNSVKAALIADAQALEKAVSAKANATQIVERSSKLRWALIAAYRLQIAPRSAPRLAGGAALYSQHCVACHGAQGRGDGPAAKGLDPAPSNFHDAGRMASRSAFGLYNTISLGVGGTAMTPFSQLSEDERWMLAFYVSNLGTPAAAVKEGEALWKASKAGDATRVAFPDLASVATLSSTEIRLRHGESAVAVQSYLRAHPEALAADKPAPIAFSRQKLAEALAAYEKDDLAAASQLAVTAYLEGFELAESGLDNVDGELRLRIEREMLALRATLGVPGKHEDVRQQIARIDALLVDAEDKLSGEGLSETAAFVSSLLILLREGLEAILILAAIIAFVSRTGRRDALAWVHAGWIAALVLGAVTWAVATYALGISGANREITEGVTALIAAAMLLYVGYWLHSRAHAQAWSRFLREQVQAALEKKTLWAMASVSFLAVYRELFEVILFYQALWVQAGEAGRHGVIGGIAAALLVLAVVGWGTFKYSLRLPLGPFFSVMSVLLALMAVIFAGQGTAALQEAGVIGIAHVPFITVSMLGIHPTLQSLGAQVLTLVLVILGMWMSRRGSTASVENAARVRAAPDAVSSMPKPESES